MNANRLPGEIEAAERRIRPHVRETALDPSPHFSQATSASVYFKCENLQHTGSFKVRGALNKLLSIDEATRAHGVVAASTGNHGAAVAYAAQQVGASGVVFVPENASPSKVEAIKRLGAEVRHHGTDCVEAEAHARRHAHVNGTTYVSPYNDPQIVAGQGTIAVELTRQLARIDAVFVALGGGGLISGVAGYLKHVNPNARVIGCSPENSQVMIQSVRAGRILDLPSLPTLSDATAGGIEPGSITFPLCAELVDDFITVTEEEIAENLRQFTAVHEMQIEGAAAVPLAALRKQPAEFQGKNVVIILCGANRPLP